MKSREFIGFTPYPHQRAVIDEIKDSSGTGKVVVCKSSRQKGKSFMLGGLLLYYAINCPNTKNYCVSPTYKQAANIFTTISDAIYRSGVLKSKNKTDLIIRLINGSTIYFKSAEQGDALRGYTADFLCVDECAFIPDDIFYKMILPWTSAKSAPMILCSTPFTKTGWFYNYYLYGMERLNNCVTIDWSDPVFKDSIERILPPEKLEEYRRMLPSNVFKTEYLGEWIDSEGIVFNNLKECIRRNAISPRDRLYCGIDWSNQLNNDETVISIFNQDGSMVYLNHFRNLSPLKQIDMIYKELEPILHQIVSITSEVNSIGTPYTEMLMKKNKLLESKIVMFNTTNQSKNAIVANFQVALENKEITLLDDEQLINQFGYFSAEYNPKTRTTTYAAPIGLHDDLVMATLLAYDGLNNGNNKGNYIIR